jgi:hypothetical protein
MAVCLCGWKQPDIPVEVGMGRLETSCTEAGVLKKFKKGWEPVPGTYTEYRLSVTPEKIVVQDKNNRGHFLQQCAAGALICNTSLQLCKIAT